MCTVEVSTVCTTTCISYIGGLASLAVSVYVYIYISISKYQYLCLSVGVSVCVCDNEEVKPCCYGVSPVKEGTLYQSGVVQLALCENNLFFFTLCSFSSLSLGTLNNYCRCYCVSEWSHCDYLFCTLVFFLLLLLMLGGSGLLW
jgi:hypothetical protein